MVILKLCGTRILLICDSCVNVSNYVITYLLFLQGAILTTMLATSNFSSK